MTRRVKIPAGVPCNLLKGSWASWIRRKVKSGIRGRRAFFVLCSWFLVAEGRSRRNGEQGAECRAERMGSGLRSGISGLWLKQAWELGGLLMADKVQSIFRKASGVSPASRAIPPMVRALIGL